MAKILQPKSGWRHLQPLQGLGRGSLNIPPQSKSDHEKVEPGKKKNLQNLNQIKPQFDYLLIIET